MARTEARVRTSIWGDPDFRTLSPNAQLTYVFLLSQSDLSYAGVLPLRVRRWAGHAAGVDAKTLGEALRELERTRFIVADRDTEELLVRTFMRNDEVFRQPNLLRSARKSLGDLASPLLRKALAVEIERCVGLAEGIAKGVLEGMLDDLATPSGTPSTTPLRVHAEKGVVTTVTTDSPSLLAPSPSALDPATPHGSSTHAPPLAVLADPPRRGKHDDPLFAEFWAAYPIRVAKDAARKAWAKAVRRVDPQRIVAGARRYCDDPNRDPQYTAHPATWLNQGRWDDEVLPPRTNAAGLVERNGFHVRPEFAARLDGRARMAALDAAEQSAQHQAIEGSTP